MSKASLINHINSEKENQIIHLADGRKLSFAEYGDPEGDPLFYFHGYPGSRFSGKELDQLARNFKIRIISPERPGMGNSDFQPDRKLLSWPDDVVNLADYLEIKKFSVIDSSGGGPYVLACAFKIPERLAKVGVVASLGPLDEIRKKNNLNKELRKCVRRETMLFSLFHPHVALSRYFILNFPDLYFWVNQHVVNRFILSQADSGFFEDTNTCTIYKVSTKEGVRQGSNGPSWEWAIYTKSWGFRLKDIKKQVRLWHGISDRHVPFPIAEYMVDQLPCVKAKFFPTAGHALLWSHGKEILATMATDKTPLI